MHMQPLDKSVYFKIIFILTKTYDVGTQKNHSFVHLKHMNKMIDNSMRYD